MMVSIIWPIVSRNRTKRSRWRVTWDLHLLLTLSISVPDLGAFGLGLELLQLPGLLVFRQQVVGLFSLYSCVSQVFIRNVFLCICWLLRSSWSFSSNKDIVAEGIPLGTGSGLWATYGDGDTRCPKSGTYGSITELMKSGLTLRKHSSRGQIDNGTRTWDTGTPIIVLVISSQAWVLDKQPGSWKWWHRYTQSDRGSKVQAHPSSLWLLN